ncbi:MAG: hypothetical protein M1812_000441 [Candelaria pacifica]|nr:MAG: hypothetical protein M1812_000441 [Candelaria pacifica]
MAPSTLPYPKTAKGKTASKTAPKSEAAVKKSRGTGARNGIPSKPTRYNAFKLKVKENHARVKAEHPESENSELRGMLSDMVGSKEDSRFITRLKVMQWKTHHTNPKSSNYDGPPITTKRK